jgi:hypothetical protein
MLKDNQLSTVLLLIALGFLIYYLTRPKTVKEGFAEAESKPVSSQSNVLPEPESPKPDSQSPKGISMAEVSQDILKQIVAEEEKPKTISGDEMDVFGFEANDMVESGAELGAAFDRPIPQQPRPDTVDLNRNNVKKYDAKDFLPKEINDQWFDTDFSQAKFNINDDKLINTERYVIGINTVGQSLKNASYDIRGTVPNPKFSVSPWNNSTYEPDMNLKSLC